MSSLSPSNLDSAVSSAAPDLSQSEDGDQGAEGGAEGEVAELLFFGKGASATLSRKVFDLCRAPVLREGYLFVRLRLHREGKTPILRIVAERNDGVPMTVADCASLSRFLSPLLEGEGLVSSQTRLEVSSPGIERPLTRMEDFRRFAGSEIVLELEREKNGSCGERRRFRGVIASAQGKQQGGQKERQVVLQTEEGEMCFSVDDMTKANLVPSWDLSGS